MALRNAANIMLSEHRRGSNSVSAVYNNEDIAFLELLLVCIFLVDLFAHRLGRIGGYFKIRNIGCTDERNIAGAIELRPHLMPLTNRQYFFLDQLSERRDPGSRG